MEKPAKTQVVLFDLLSALIDSWSLWNEIAGSEADGKRWRMEYLRLTYGCGAYRDYETLCHESAINCGYDPKWADTLAERYGELKPWPEARAALAELKKHYRLGVVTNCSKRLGHLAASLVGIDWDIVITSDEAGYYKPDPRTYQMALDVLGVKASEALFVAGSCYDLLGTSRVGLDTIWHNRVGMIKPEGFRDPLIEIRTLENLPELVERYASR